MVHRFAICYLNKYRCSIVFTLLHVQRYFTLPIAPTNEEKLLYKEIQCLELNFLVMTFRVFILGEVKFIQDHESKRNNILKRALENYSYTKCNTNSN